jgi:hypothetical protein
MGDKTSFEQEVRRSLDFIEDVAGAALKFDRLTADDREIIKKGLARVRPAFDELAKWFIEPLRQTKPSNVEYGYEKLYELVSWAWALGAKADVPESADSYVHSRHAKGERPLKPINKAILDLLQ